MVHEAVLTEQSPALAALMRGEMAESVAGMSRWMDVDKGTFIRFAQFAYIGDYSIPKASIAQAVVEAKSSSPSREPLVLYGWQLLQPPPSARSSFAPPPPRPPPSAQDPDEECDSFQSKKGNKSKHGPFNSHKSVPDLPTSASDIFNSLKYPLIESRSNLCTCKSSMNDDLVH